jgi:hypothetical protein
MIQQHACRLRLHLTIVTLHDVTARKAPDMARIIDNAVAKFLARLRVVDSSRFCSRYD